MTDLHIHTWSVNYNPAFTQILQRTLNSIFIDFKSLWANKTSVYTGTPGSSRTLHAPIAILKQFSSCHWQHLVVSVRVQLVTAQTILRNASGHCCSLLVVSGDVVLNINSTLLGDFEPIVTKKYRSASLAYWQNRIAGDVIHRYWSLLSGTGGSYGDAADGASGGRVSCSTRVPYSWHRDDCINYGYTRRRASCRSGRASTPMVSALRLSVRNITTIFF